MERELEDFWNNNGGVRMIDELVRYAQPVFHEMLQGLFRGDYLETFVCKALIFPELKGNTAAIWSLFCMPDTLNHYRRM